MSGKVAIVTGANKGIGYAIVRGLCKRFDGFVYLTSRDVERGKKAVADLEKEGLHPSFHQLDVTDNKSIETFRDFIKKKHGGIDILINNAAVYLERQKELTPSVQAEQTIAVNYFAVLNTCEILFPILKNGARVVNVSSSVGHLSYIPCKSLRNRLKDPKLTIPELSELMQQYVKKAKEGTQAEEWGTSPYNVSKVGLSAMSIIHQRMLNDRDIKVNSVHPGYVDTDLTAHQGPLTIDEGASAPLYLALDADDTVRGQYVWRDNTIVDWDGKTPSLH